MERDINKQLEAMHIDHELHISRMEYRPIDEGHAAEIAALYATNPTSPLAHFAATGAINKPELVEEMINVLREPELDHLDREFIDALALHLFMADTDNQGLRGDIEGWEPYRIEQDN